MGAPLRAAPHLLPTRNGDTNGDGAVDISDAVYLLGQDGFYKLGCPEDGRFQVNGDGTINDLCTGLQWTRGNVDVDGDGEIVTGDGFMNPGPDELPWLKACQFAVDMTYLGHDDWRIPNINELLSIIKMPSQVTHGELGFQKYWSSTHRMSIGLGGRNDGCCSGLIHYVDRQVNHIFVAVRGPF